MIEEVVKIVNLSKSYNHNYALSDVSITLHPGRIYGFIGQNGAGKTTLLRIITGLAFPTAGSIALFGAVDQNGLENARKQIGCMIEHSGMYPNFTARENLELQRVLKGISDKESVERVLEVVDLVKTGNKKFKDFSMGMKQRLGIAAALLGNPKLLILDEPLNGLDPMGIVEIRELLIKLNKEHNLTILISSHILSELFMLASDYIIIHEGKIMDCLTQSELADKCKKHVIIEADNVDRAVYVLKNHLKTNNYEVGSDSKIKLFDYFNDRNLLAQTFFNQDVLITELSYAEETLESYFIYSIKGGKHAAIEI